MGPGGDMARATCARAAIAILSAAVLFAGGLRVSIAVAADGESSLPVPRFVSLHADKVNLRTGPGDRYPIEWVFTRKEMPVEITGQLEHWRRIRDWEGTTGWVHERMLTGKRGVIVRGGVRVLYRQPDPNAAVIARAEPGVIGRLLECRAAWCKVETGDVSGWVRRSDVWGVYPDETIP
jgi:SH3-like domain-containing protein